MALRSSYTPVGDSTPENKQSQSQSNLTQRWRTKRVRFITLALAVFAIVLVACGGSGTLATAPNFTFSVFQGQDQLIAGASDLNALQGKPVVVNFWAGLCPPCRAEMPDLQEFYEEFSDRVTLIGIDLGQFTGLGTRQDAQNLLEELGVTYPMAFTDASSVIGDYRILGMPTTIFIDADGNVFKNWGGTLNADILRDQSLAMLNQ